MVGEHIRALKGGRWIHAIDCGDQTVLHLAEDAAPPRVRRAYRPEFVAHAEFVEHVTHRERTFPPKEIVRRAYSRAADPTLAAMFRDSEAFAAWCATGRPWAPRNFAVLVPGAAANEGLGDVSSRSLAPRAKRPAAKRTRANRPAKRARPKAPARGASVRRPKVKTGSKRSRRAGRSPGTRAGGAKRPAKKAARRRRLQK